MRSNPTSPQLRGDRVEASLVVDFLNAYFMQSGLESDPQRFLENTDFGHAPGANEAERLLTNPPVRRKPISTTVRRVVGERADCMPCMSRIAAISGKPGLLEAQVEY